MIYSTMHWVYCSQLGILFSRALCGNRSLFYALIRSSEGVLDLHYERISIEMPLPLRNIGFSVSSQLESRTDFSLYHVLVI